MKTPLIRMSAALMLFASMPIATAQNFEVTYQGHMLDHSAGFTGTGQFQFAIVTGTNIAQTATATANPPSGGFITIINVISGGFGYTNPPAVTISGGGGAGATATASVSGGLVTTITVNHAGSNYTSTPTVVVAAPPPDIAYTSYWSNDETSTNGSEPASSVSVVVSNGLFVVALGDTTISNMAPLDPLIFQQPGLQLRIWFNDGVDGFVDLEPPQKLTAAPYAAMANTVNEVSAAQLGANPVFSGTAFADGFSSTDGLFLGGQGNSMGADALGCTIGGGTQNSLGATNAYATIAGGYYNSTGDGGDYAVIGGGGFNQMGTNNFADTIAGGFNNFMGTNVWAAFIGGGDGNQILGTATGGFYSYAVIGGGSGNIVGGGSEGTIAGGLDNQVGGGVGGYDYAPFIGGGYNNIIGSNASGAVITGGFNNHIGDGTPGFAPCSAIAGGYQNFIGTNGGNDFIGGGAYNQIGNGAPGFDSASVIAGGYNNIIGTNSTYSVISGGYYNTIQSNAQYSTIPGGANNVAGGNYTFAAGFHAYATNNNSFVWSDGSANTGSAAVDSVTFRASGGYRFFTGSGAGGAQLAAGATAWSILCDREAKKNFQPVDTLAVLNKLALVPVQEWNYRWEKDSDVPNIGPVAQDFKAAFYAGRDDKTITTLEFDGVELAAIQGLNRKLENQVRELEGRSRTLEAENAALTARLEKLERLVAAENGGKP